MILLKPPYFIAEMSANHCGSITKALKIIKCAKKYGADAIKLQTFTPKSTNLFNFLMKQVCSKTV